jgi:hypothetical protein
LGNFKFQQFFDAAMLTAIGCYGTAIGCYGTASDCFSSQLLFSPDFSPSAAKSAVFLGLLFGCFSSRAAIFSF